MLATSAVADAAASSRRVIGLSIGAIGVIVVLLLIGLPLWMDRAIVRPARDAVRVADAVARGDLTVRVTHAGDDEFGQLARALQGMVSTLQRFSQAQTEMAAAHDAGAMSARMPAGQFQGSYADMANAVNAIASELIATTMRVIEVNERYARGDFSTRLEPLPREKA